jgi:hypothetical protein
MLHAALLAAAVATAPSTASVPAKTSIQQCFEAMDGAVYRGDPADRPLMKANVAACERGIKQIGRMRPTAAQGPEKLFLTGRILDRAATLSYIGLDDAATALREVTAANLDFRVASGLPNESEDYHNAALANVRLTTVQLHTLRAEIAALPATHAAQVALRTHHTR